MASKNTNNGGDVGSLSKEELKVYDRQIRLWGHDGQKKYTLIIKPLEFIVFLSTLFSTLGWVRGKFF